MWKKLPLLKKIEVLMLTLSLPLIALFIIIGTMFSTKYFLMERSINLTSIVFGLCIGTLLVLLTFLFYSLLSIKLPDIKKEGFSSWISMVLLVYFTDYVFLGLFVWLFLLGSLATLFDGSPEYITNVVPSITLILVASFRSLLYFDESFIKKIIKKDYEKLIFGTIKLDNLRSVISDIIISGFFFSMLLLFINGGSILGTLGNLYTIGYVNLLVLGLLGLLIEFWAISFSNNISLILKEMEKTKKQKKMSPKFKSLIRINKHFEKHQLKYSYGLLILIMFIMPTALVVTNIVNYGFNVGLEENMELVEVNARYVEFSLLNESIYTIKFLQDGDMEDHEYSYPIINIENRTEIFTKSDKERTDRKMLNYPIHSYFNIRSLDTKSLIPVRFKKNITQRQKENYIRKSVYNNAVTPVDGDILIFLDKKNISTVCTVFFNIPFTFNAGNNEVIKIYLFKRAEIIEVIVFGEDSYIVPYNLRVSLLTQDKEFFNDFNMTFDRKYSVTKVNVTERNNWNLTEAYELCRSKITSK